MVKVDLEERVNAVLLAIVESYIQTAEPVGSRTLSKHQELGISPATIRNVMADLTEQGYLAQPHTSSGRVPTDKAYRFYVDAGSGGEFLSQKVKREIDEAIRDSSDSLEKMLENTTMVLAGLTKSTCVVAGPRVNTTRLRMIEFLRIGEEQIMVVLITQSNMVYNKVIEVSEDLTQDFLNSVSRYLNDQFSDRSLHEIRQNVLESLVEEKEQYDQLLAQVVRLGKKAFDFSDERMLYVEGKYNIINEINDIECIQRFLKALEEKIAVLTLLDQTLTVSGVNTLIGMENQLVDFQDFSLVIANYGNGPHVLGSLGVIGPTRMDYFRVIPIIEYASRTLSQVITNH